MKTTKTPSRPQAVSLFSLLCLLAVAVLIYRTHRLAEETSASGPAEQVPVLALGDLRSSPPSIPDSLASAICASHHRADGSVGPPEPHPFVAAEVTLYLYPLDPDSSPRAVVHVRGPADLERLRFGLFRSRRPVFGMPFACSTTHFGRLDVTVRDIGTVSFWLTEDGFYLGPGLLGSDVFHSPELGRALVNLVREAEMIENRERHLLRLQILAADPQLADQP